MKTTKASWLRAVCQSHAAQVYGRDKPLAQKLSPVKLRLRPRKFRAIEIALFPFMKPTTLDTANFGGMLMQHMDVIALQMPFQDATFLLLRQLVKNLSQMPPNRPVDFLPSVFGDKDNMVFAVVPRICSRTACAIGFRSFSLSPPCLEVGAFQGGLCYYCLTRSNLCESPRQSRGFTCDNYGYHD